MSAIGIIGVGSLMVSVFGTWVVSVPVVKISEPEPIKITQVQPVVFQALESNIAKEPIPPIEERGDAMLFEVEALGGTPFDQSIIMPFD